MEFAETPLVLTPCLSLSDLGPRPRHLLDAPGVRAGEEGDLILLIIIIIIVIIIILMITHLMMIVIMILQITLLLVIVIMHTN